MPTRKKEILLSTLDATETAPVNSQELLTITPEEPLRPKRKSAQRKVSMPKEIIEVPPLEEVSNHKLTDIINKKKRKETHTKEKFYIRNDLLERLKALTKGKKSLKTTFINEALEKLLNKTH